MAHATLHFAAGLSTGMMVMGPSLRRAWDHALELPPSVGRWMAASWGLGFWAVIPSLLHFAGMPDSLCQGWWMNLFLFHPLINQHGPHATIIGSASFVGAFAFQYGVILLAIRSRRRKTLLP